MCTLKKIVLLILWDLYVLSIAFTAIVLSGKECSGKTKALQTVIAALNTLSLSNGGTPIKLQRLYPGALSSVNELYGSFDKLSGGWTDGIFTSLFRKALKVRQPTVKKLVFDYRSGAL